MSGVVAKDGTNHSNYLLSKYREVMKINVVVVAVSHAFKKTNIGNVFSLLFFPPLCSDCPFHHFHPFFLFSSIVCGTLYEV